ncbi:hypothetical protein HO133_006420 [Letharia lupina]|uniref:Piwi domain-containing protein n=1 Tax=Letharia lupina TaxID=560253 RepID=A0A8H6C6S4_9LECA|nr:uncharacterized protein HO133_006420 [Letharia lupina]KAF6218008.1 hypothetical protein HO133_006420 [Letharia lupina]
MDFTYPKFNQIKPQDIATAHLRAATVPQASNGRFIVSQGQIGSQQISALLRHNLPALASRTPEGTPSTSSLPANAYGADSSPAEQVLGVELRSTADTFAEFGEMVGGGWGTAVSRAGGGGDYVRGIRTICITSSRFKKGSSDISAGIAFKYNVKSGRINQALTTRDLDLPKSVEGGTVLVGIDVTHQAPGSMDGVPSIASVVASIDSKEIIVYRDGVFEGQSDDVLKTELKGVQNACGDLDNPEDMPKIAIIIVGKRHHTRFHPATKGKADIVSNWTPPNGTAIDRGITMERLWGF